MAGRLYLNGNPIKWGNICNAADQLWIAASRGNIPLRDNLRY